MKNIAIAFIILSLIEGLPLLSTAQTATSKGIKWTTGLSWEQVKQKAKAANKYIFIDCYATWCAPCKAMDKNVYSDIKIVELLNDNFIAVKLQMDKTNNDDEAVKEWYDDALNIKRSYSVTPFPTLLFFSWDGKPMHKSVGYKSVQDFTELVRDAFDSEKQYYKILSNFQPGVMDTAELKGLARSFRLSGKELAMKLAADYLDRIPKEKLSQQDNLQFMIEFNESPEVQKMVANYFNNLPDKEIGSTNNLALIRGFSNFPQVQVRSMKYLATLNDQSIGDSMNLALLRIFKDQNDAKQIANRYIEGLTEREIFTKSTILFIEDFTTSSKDTGFCIFYKNEEKVNLVMSTEKKAGIYWPLNFAETIVDRIIKKEEIEPYWDEALAGKNIPWRDIFNKIKKKYSERYADRNTLQAKVILYEYFAKKYNKNWEEYIKYNIRLIERYGTDTTSGYADVTRINNFAWDAIFFHSTNKKQIKTAIKWMEGVVRRAPTEDSRIDTYANLLFKAGKTRDAILWENKALAIAIEKKDEYNIKTYQEIIRKMKAGEKTWLLENN